MIEQKGFNRFSCLCVLTLLQTLETGKSGKFLNNPTDEMREEDCVQNEGKERRKEEIGKKSAGKNVKRSFLYVQKVFAVSYSATHIINVWTRHLGHTV